MDCSVSVAASVGVLVGQAGTIGDARAIAYEAVDAVSFNGKQYRTDIGALKKGNAP